MLSMGWVRTDSVANHVDDDGVEAARPDHTTDAHWTDIENNVSDFKDQEYLVL